MGLIQTPECDKWAKVHDDSIIIHEFIEFLSSKGILLGKLDGEYGDIKIAHSPSLQELIYEHFGIDFNKLEKERRALLASCKS